jgi:hypothetical protein
VYKDFAVNTAATKVATLGPQAKLLLGNRGNNSLNRKQIVVREERTARIDRGHALHHNLSFETVNHRRGYCCSKKLKGEDWTVVYQLTATYLLKVNRSNFRVVEECKLRFSTVNILSGRTVAWSNEQRVGNKGCLTQEERDGIAKIVIAYPKKANFHLLEPGTPEHGQAIKAGM